MNRPTQFLRSVLPADLTQLVFVGGIVCLVVATRARWAPPLSAAPQLVNQFEYYWSGFVALAIWPLIVAGMAGYFVAFWPSNRPIRRIVLWVFLPATLAMSLICGRFIYLTNPPTSVFDTAGDNFRWLSGWPERLWGLGPGFHFCVVGLALLAIFIYRLISSRVSLPLILSQHGSVVGEDPSWKRLQFFVWVLLGPIVFTGRVLPAIASVIARRIEWAWLPWLLVALGALLSFGLAFWAFGEQRMSAVRRAIGVPRFGYFLLALSLPIGISIFLSTSHYLVDRAQWASYAFGRYSPPELASYFEFPNPWRFFGFLGAFSEEVVFRGMLQPRFVQRFGVYRGIFLVAVTWAGCHFQSDVYRGQFDLQVLLGIVSRVVGCIALGFVFSWLTIRSGSVLPAAVAHTLHNVSIGLASFFVGKDVVRIGLWAVLAYVLFRYWPVRQISEAERTGPVPEAIPESLSPQP